MRGGPGFTIADDYVHGKFSPANLGRALLSRRAGILCSTIFRSAITNLHWSQNFRPSLFLWEIEQLKPYGVAIMQKVLSSQKIFSISPFSSLPASFIPCTDPTTTSPEGVCVGLKGLAITGAYSLFAVCYSTTRLALLGWALLEQLLRFCLQS